jgi:hypothetical protein
MTINLTEAFMIVISPSTWTPEYVVLVNSRQYLRIPPQYTFNNCAIIFPQLIQSRTDFAVSTSQLVLL